MRLTADSGPAVPWRRLAFLAILGLLPCGAPAASCLAEEPSSETYFDFRNGHVPPEIRFQGRSAEFIHPEAEGLRITVRKNEDRHPPVTLTTDTSITGDFEITLSVQFLETEEPPPGDASYGVGLTIAAVTTEDQTARLGWYVRSGGRRVILWDRWKKIEPRYLDGDTVSVHDKPARLRLSRSDKTLRFLWSDESTGDTFRIAHECDYPGEVKGLRLVAETNKLARNLDVRLLDLRIRGGKVRAQQTMPTFWLTIALVTMLCLSIVVGYTYVRWHRRTSPRAMATEPTVPEAAVPPHSGQHSRLAIFWLSGAVFLTLIGALAYSATHFVFPAASFSNEVYFDFRNGNLPPELAFANAKKVNQPADKFIHPELEGLRISIPKEKVDWPRIMMQVSTALAGDFEVTTSLEILHVDDPVKESGYGVGILFALAAKEKNARMGWYARPGKRLVIWDRWDNIGRQQIDGDEMPAQEKSGRFRIKRTGNVVQYLWSRELTGENFDALHQGEFANEVKWVRLVAETSGLPCSLDTRFLDLRIRGTSGKGESAPVNPPRTRLLLGLLTLMFVSALAVGMYLWQRVRTAKATLP
jgi:hypothetical protein